MALIRWSPARELSWFPLDVVRTQRGINRIFDSFFRGDGDEDLFPAVWSPAVDIDESDDDYVVNVELPGVSKDEVNITVQDNVLTIRGEKKHENETKKSNFHRVERSYGSFQRSFTLPTTVKTDKIDALYKEGILTITLPKAEDAKPKAIEVKVK